MSRGERDIRWYVARVGVAAMMGLAAYGFYDIGRDAYQDWQDEQDFRDQAISIGQSNFEKLSQAMEDDVKELGDVNGGSFIRIPRPGSDAILMVLKRPTHNGSDRYALLESADCIWEAADARGKLDTKGTSISTDMQIDRLNVLVQEQLPGITVGRITGYTIGEETVQCEVDRMFDFGIPDWVWRLLPGDE